MKLIHLIVAIYCVGVWCADGQYTLKDYVYDKSDLCVVSRRLLKKVSNPRFDTYILNITTLKWLTSKDDSTSETSLRAFDEPF